MTNTTASRLRLLSSPEPVPPGRGFDDAFEAFGRRLAAEGRSENTISAYLRDLSYLSDTLLRNHPGIVPDGVTRPMIDEALTSPLVVVRPGPSRLQVCLVHASTLPRQAWKDNVDWLRRSTHRDSLP